MGENKEVKTEKTCSCKSDFRAFIIALLTAIIVVSVYHFARGYCHMKRQILRTGMCKQQVVFVPCRCCQPCGAPGRLMPPPGRRVGDPRMVGPKGRRMHHPMHDGKFRGKEFPGKNAPAKPAADPVKKAPAPAPASEKPAPAPAPAAPAPAPAAPAPAK